MLTGKIKRNQIRREVEDDDIDDWDEMYLGAADDQDPKDEARKTPSRFIK